MTNIEGQPQELRETKNESKRKAISGENPFAEASKTREN
jgi:hypothetical protein